MSDIDYPGFWFFVDLFAHDCCDHSGGYHRHKAFLQSANIVHADLSCRNVLLFRLEVHALQWAMQANMIYARTTRDEGGVQNVGLFEH